MKTCKNCNINVNDDEIYCPQCGDMLLGCAANNELPRRIGTSSTPAAPLPMTVGDIVLGKRYGKRMISALRVIATVIGIAFALAFIYCGVMCVLGIKTYGLPAERQTIFGILALPVGMLVGFLVYFILNIFITHFENLSLVGRNTEAQLIMLENQSALISALINTVAESNRRIDVIGEMLDDHIRIQEEQTRTLEQLAEAQNEPNDSDSAVIEENINLINENLCAGAANTQTLLERVETAVSFGLNKLYKMFYTALNHGDEAPEESFTPPRPRPARIERIDEPAAEPVVSEPVAAESAPVAESEPEPVYTPAEPEVPAAVEEAPAVDNDDDDDGEAFMLPTE